MAEYFEQPQLPLGMNREHLGHLPQDVNEGWTPDLARLETMTDVRQMSPRDYREAWAWVHFLLNTTADRRAVLLGAIARRDGTEAAMPIQQRLEREQAADALGSELRAHLESLDRAPMAQRGVARVKVRSQNLDPAVTRAALEPKRERGWLGRAVDVVRMPIRRLLGSPDEP